MGRHHRKTGNPAAWIEILVGHIYDYQHWPARHLPLLRHLPLASVLYHEIGHHIHTTSAPEHGYREEVADRWERRLLGSFLRRR